jgi:hypothetical protein
LEEISEYGAGARYPNVVCDPTLEEARYAHEAALNIRELVLQYLKF